MTLESLLKVALGCAAVVVLASVVGSPLGIGLIAVVATGVLLGTGWLTKTPTAAGSRDLVPTDDEPAAASHDER